MTAVLEDPWVWRGRTTAAPAGTAIRVASTTFRSTQSIAGGRRLEVQMAGANDPDRRQTITFRMQLNGRTVAEEFFNGRTAKSLTAEVDLDELRLRRNADVEVSQPGGTDAFVDMVLLESVDPSRAGATRAENNRILIPEATSRAATLPPMAS